MIQMSVARPFLFSRTQSFRQPIIWCDVRLFLKLFMYVLVAWLTFLFTVQVRSQLHTRIEAQDREIASLRKYSQQTAQSKQDAVQVRTNWLGIFWLCGVCTTFFQEAFRSATRCTLQR